MRNEGKPIIQRFTWIGRKRHESHWWIVLFDEGPSEPIFGFRYACIRATQGL